MSTISTKRQFPHYHKYTMDLAGRPLLLFVGKLAEPAVAKMFSTLFFSLAFVCVGLETRLKEIISKENRNALWAFLTAQCFNIVVTFVIAVLLFGVLKPMWA